MHLLPSRVQLHCLRLAKKYCARYILSRAVLTRLLVLGDFFSRDARFDFVSACTPPSLQAERGRDLAHHTAACATGEHTIHQHRRLELANNRRLTAPHVACLFNTVGNMNV